MASKTLILVTGGNGGIGYELVRQLLAHSSRHVLLGSRSAEKGEAAVKELQSQNPAGSVEVLEVDISNEDSIVAADKSVDAKYGRLDALVNNAGVAMPPGAEGIAQQMAACYKTNVIGTQLMVDYFAPLLRKAQGVPRIVNVSSSQGSITRRLNPEVPGYQVGAVWYRASKSGENMVTACQIVDYAADGFKIWAYCPGFTESNLSGMNRSASGAKPTSEGAAPIVKLLDGERDAEAGKFVHEHGQYEW